MVGCMNILNERHIIFVLRLLPTQVFLFFPQTNETIFAVYDRFISENQHRLEDLFLQMDKSKSGNITLEEFKYGLKDFGIRLTSVCMKKLHLYEFTLGRVFIYFYFLCYRSSWICYWINWMKIAAVPLNFSKRISYLFITLDATKNINKNEN